MPGRSQTLGSALATLAVLCALLLSSPARAELSGAVDARPLFGIDGRYGGALMVDLWGTRGIVRPGGSFGIGALSAGDDATSSRFLTPVAFSLAVVPRPDRSSFFLVARAGGFLGAEKGGFAYGAFFGGSLGYGISLGEGATFRIGADAWGLVGDHGGLFLGPSLGLGF